ncbi:MULTISPECIES: MmpS family transport accessory protein [Rhodococcus]|uniref:MmpS family transport accessory protein n=1 Tax=Rhodococcus TaxID=1827 RepID=UPI0029545978|nr:MULTISPECIES: MmpS family transport accessory protein [Rhodococcus]MDV7244462.1 MmpS family transport accessory protein [Rhodococcus oxybenzonivorans]MDV7274295.1 MmpS family transport accessory protein [Rhodococcus oxybenzonivorans]MDV7337819.1 MmpS family transport accessory protein [Rhodococcus oxybenzonivorans]MDV7345245.1 MmpS family transport accessory protein [Rhodococcus oxybenzonivorans]MDV8028933.1 MmpS family transport accessory protein [Rhodococcus sp. IEGM 27]
MTQPPPPQQPYGQQPGPGQYPQQQPPKKRKKWPWILLAIVVLFVIIAVATSGGEDKGETTAGTSASPAAPGVAPAEGGNTIPPLAPAAPSGEGKSIVYEVISDSGELNNVTWFDENSAIQQQSTVPAPWTLTVNNPSTFVIAGVGAQTTGTSVTCRVIVDGEVEDEQTATGQYAVVNCNAGL